MTRNNSEEVLQPLASFCLYEQVDVVSLDGIFINFDLKLLRVLFDQVEDHFLVSKQRSRADGMVRLQGQMMALLEI